MIKTATFYDFESLQRFFRYNRDVLNISTTGPCISVTFRMQPIEEEAKSGNVLWSVAGSNLI